MRFRDVAAFFDRMPCQDAYTNLAVFYGQLGLYDDSKRDSAVAQRRIISTTATALIPARRVIRAQGVNYIVGHANPDNFNNETHRVGYVVHEASHLATIKTLREATLGLPGDTAYAARTWLKDKSFSEQSSDLNPEYQIYFASTEVVREFDVIGLGSDSYIVRSANQGASGTLIAICDELQGIVFDSAEVQSGRFNPLTETLVGSSFSAVPVLRLRWQALYQYAGKQSPAFEPGDIQVVVAKSSAVLTAGSTLTLSDGIWRALSVQSFGDVWLARCTQKG